MACFIFADLIGLQVITTQDDPTLPVLTFRSAFLGIGLSAFGAVSVLTYSVLNFERSTKNVSQVLGTIYTFKPQNASVSQLFCLIIAYVLGEAMASKLLTSSLVDNSSC